MSEVIIAIKQIKMLVSFELRKFLHIKLRVNRYPEYFCSSLVLECKNAMSMKLSWPLDEPGHVILWLTGSANASFIHPAQRNAFYAESDFEKNTHICGRVH